MTLVFLSGVSQVFAGDKRVLLVLVQQELLGAGGQFEALDLFVEELFLLLIVELGRGGIRVDGHCLCTIRNRDCRRV